MAFFDLIFSVPISGWQVYTESGVWIGYVLVVFVPIVAVRIFYREGSI